MMQVKLSVSPDKPGAKARPLLWPIIFLLLFTRDARADWINLTGAETAANIAEIYVLDDHVRLVLEVYVGDLEVFDILVPDEWLKDEQVQRPAVHSASWHWTVTFDRAREDS